MSRLYTVTKCVLALTLGVVSAGCSDDSDGDTLTPESFGEQLTEVYCGNVTACCNSAGAPVDAAACKSMVQSRLASASSYPFHADVASRCLDSMRNLPQSCNVFYESLDCNAAYRGSKAIGEECEATDECAQSVGEETYCTMRDDFTSARCTRVVQAGIGNRCDSLPDETNTAYDCDWDTQYCAYPDAVCAGRVAIGGDCYEGDSCARNAFCDMSVNKCKEKLQLGASCQNGSDCISYNCGESGSCEDASGMFTTGCAQMF